MSTIEQTLDLSIGEDLNLENAPSIATKLSSLAEDKAKVFFEILANASFYVSKFTSLPEACEKNFQAVKTAMGLPSFVKGAMSLTDNIWKGKLPFKKTVVDLSFLVSDGVDTVKTLGNLTIYTASKATTELLGKVKNVAGLIGVGIQLKDGLNDASKLAKIDPELIDETKVADVEKAVEIKRHWVVSELSAKQWENAKNITGIAVILLNLSVGVMPWTFALIGTCSIAAKIMNHMHKCDSAYWNNRFVQVLK